MTEKTQSHLCRRYAQPSGFTLLELIISVAVLCIITVAGVPSYQWFIAGQKVKMQAQTLHIGLSSARAQAIKRNGSVYLHPADGKDWDSGWYATTESAVKAIDCNGKVDTSQVLAMQCGATLGDVDITLTPAQTTLEFRPDGRTQLARYDLCHKESGAGRSIWVDVSGAASFTPEDACS